MGTFLLDLLPDYLGSIAAALEGLRITVRETPATCPCPHGCPCPPSIGVSSSGCWDSGDGTRPVGTGRLGCGH